MGRRGTASMGRVGRSRARRRCGSTVEQLICNQWVAGSIPVAGTIENAGRRAILLGGLFILWAHFAPWVLSGCCLADALDRRQPPDVRHCRRRASPQIDSAVVRLALRLASVRFSGPSPVLARFLLRICLVSAIRPLQKQKIGHFCNFFSIRDPFPLWQGESEPLRDW